MELYIHFPNTPSWCGAQLKHRDNFTQLHLRNEFSNNALQASRFTFQRPESFQFNSAKYSATSVKFCECLLLCCRNCRSSLLHIVEGENSSKSLTIFSRFRPFGLLKAKLFLCLRTMVWRHSTGSRGKAPSILNFGTGCRWTVSQLHALAPSPRYPLDTVT